MQFKRMQDIVKRFVAEWIDGEYRDHSIRFGNVEAWLSLGPSGETTLSIVGGDLGAEWRGLDRQDLSAAVFYELEVRRQTLSNSLSSR